MQSGPNRLVALRPRCRTAPPSSAAGPAAVCRFRPHRHAAACRSRPSSRLLAPAARLSIRPPVPLPSPSLFFSHSQAVANGSLRVPLLGFIDNGVLPKESHTLATNRRFTKITSLRRRFRSPLRYADLRNRRSQNKPCLTRLPVFRKTTTGRHLRTAFA